jgi:hypothetical protein
MSRRTSQIAAALAACAVAVGCGQRPDSGGGRFGFELYVEGALPANSKFQITLLTDGTSPSRDCATLLGAPAAPANRCLNSRGFKPSDLVPLFGSDRRQLQAFVVDVQSSATDGGTQDAQITAAVGTRYTLVIEALSGQSPPQLLGTSCTYLPAGIRDGDNGTKLADPMRSNPDPCNPIW